MALLTNFDYEKVIRESKRRNVLLDLLVMIPEDSNAYKKCHEELMSINASIKQDLKIHDALTGQMPPIEQA